MITLGEKDGTFSNTSCYFTIYFLLRILARLLPQRSSKAKGFISQMTAKLGYFFLFLLLNFILIFQKNTNRKLTFVLRPCSHKYSAFVYFFKTLYHKKNPTPFWLAPKNTQSSTTNHNTVRMTGLFYLASGIGLDDFLPLILNSCEVPSGSLSAFKAAFGGTGGTRILKPNKCFFFFISFPDINLDDDKLIVKILMGR